MIRPAVFLDRDGTLIEDAHYLSSPNQIKWLPGVLENLKTMKAQGYLLIVISNQSGIGRGYFTAEDYNKVKEVFEKQAKDNGTAFDAVYHCPHWPEKDGPCDCRKPGKALFEKAIADFEIDCAKSIAVGDRQRDLTPAEECGVGQTFMVPKDQGLVSIMENFIS